MLMEKPPLIVRLKLALCDVHSGRVTRTSPLDGDVGHYRRHGFTEQEFWNIALDEPMPAIDFIDMLVGYFCPWSEDASGRKVVGVILRRVLVEAFDAREAWIYLGGRQVVCRGIQSLHVRPREAAEWLAKPKREHLLPTGLKQFLAGSIISAATHKTSIEVRLSNKRGRRPTQGVNVEVRMKQWDLVKLASLTRESMAAEFGASASTCAKVRKRVLENSQQ